MNISAEQLHLIHPESLGDTLDAVNKAFFDHEAISSEACLETARWVADRQGLPGAYAGMFAPTEYDYAFGTLTFTGEPVRSGAATGHILSEEACAALYRLGQMDSRVKGSVEVQGALEKARRGIMRRMADAEVLGEWSGVYCCGMCSVSLWRHLMVSGISEDQRRLANGLSELHRHRDGQGRWRRFPFYYTLLALIDIDLPGVSEEINYATGVIERSWRRLEKHQTSEHDRRKKILMERILEKC